MAKKDKNLIDSIKEFLKTIFFALLIAGLIRTLFFQPFWIPSGSMKPNLLIGDYIFVNKFDIKIFNSIRYKTKNTHGTGCTLSSAITTFLSCGKTIKKSCELGINYVSLAIKTNPNYGKGHGPINHLNAMNLKKKFRQ